MIIVFFSDIFAGGEPRTGLPIILFGGGRLAFVETIFEFETRTGGEERIVDGELRRFSILYGLKEEEILFGSCDGDNLLIMVGVVVVVFKSFFSASVLPMLLQVAANRANGDALLSDVYKMGKR